MADHPGGLPGLGNEQLLLVVCSTHGDGVPPSEARGFVDWLHASAPRLEGLRFSVCALGDRCAGMQAAAPLLLLNCCCC